MHRPTATSGNDYRNVNLSCYYFAFNGKNLVYMFGSQYCREKVAYFDASKVQ